MRSRSEQITAAIVDDEPLGRRRVRQLLSDHADIRVVGEAATLTRAEKVVLSEKPDLLYLDVQLPDGSAFDLLSRLGNRHDGQTIFITAHVEHAARAFDTPAVDYLVKPLERDRFARALERVRRIHVMERQPAGCATGAEVRPQRLAVDAGDGVLRLVPLSRIDRIEAAGNYVRIHAGGVVEMFRDTLTSLEHRLDRQQFVRVHRSWIVNIDRVAQLEPNAYGDYVISLEDGARLPLSRRYSDRIGLLLGHL